MLSENERRHGLRHVEILRRGKSGACAFNRLFPSSCLPRFRSESWCSTIVREMSLICIRIRNSFPLNGCAPGLALKLRHAQLGNGLLASHGQT